MILHRYLVREVFKRLILVTVVFWAIFAAYSAAIFLSRSASGFLDPQAVASLVFLKALVAGDVILPIALYAAVIVTLEHLRRSREITALEASGFSPRKMEQALLWLFVPLALAAGLLALVVRPWAYAAMYQIRAEGEAAFDLNKVQPGHFYADAKGERVVLARSRTSRTLSDVFVWINRGSSILVVRAGQTAPTGKTDRGLPVFQVHDMSTYILENRTCKLKMKANKLNVNMNWGGLASVGYKRKAASTLDLWHSTAPADAAEFQWRLSRALSALLLGWLSVRLGLFSSRRRAKRAILAVAVCALYEFAGMTAMNWVKDGVVPSFPGLWWVDATLILILAAGFPREGVWRLRRASSNLRRSPVP